LFRVNGAVERDPAIDRWMEKHSGETGDIAQKWFEVMQNCGYEVREILHDGCPTACLADAAFGYVNVFKSPHRSGVRGARRAASIAAMSIFFIVIIASKAPLASPPPAASASVSARGVICQERPQRSLHQPHWLSVPPLPTIAFQYRSVSS
jgi:hypothetical protein